MIRIKEEHKKFLDDAYRKKRELLHYRFNVVNIKRAQEREDELFRLGEYLPNLLRGFLSLNYYARMEEMGVIDDVLWKMGKTRKQGMEADTIEYVEWISEHDEFVDLINEKELKMLDEGLKELENEFNVLYRRYF